MCIDVAMNNNISTEHRIDGSAALFGNLHRSSKLRYQSTPKSQFKRCTSSIPGRRMHEHKSNLTAKVPRTRVYTRHDVATRTYHVFFNKKILQENAQHGSEGECLV